MAVDSRRGCPRQKKEVGATAEPLQKIVRNQNTWEESCRTPPLPPRLLTQGAIGNAVKQGSRVEGRSPESPCYYIIIYVHSRAGKNSANCSPVLRLRLDSAQNSLDSFHFPGLRLDSGQNSSGRLHFGGLHLFAGNSSADASHTLGLRFNFGCPQAARKQLGQNFSSAEALVKPLRLKLAPPLTAHARQRWPLGSHRLPSALW